MRFALLLLQLLPSLPSLIQTVEALHFGAGSTSAQKLASAVQIFKAVEPEIGEAIGADPTKQAHVEDTISAVVGVMNAVGALKKAVPVPA